MASGLGLDKWAKFDEKKFKVKVFAPAFYKKRHQSMKEIIEGAIPENAATLIPFLPKDKIDLDLLRDFLIKNEDKMSNGNYSSYFKKLVALYDKLKWRWSA